MLLLTSCCAPDPGKTVTVAVDANLANVIGPILKTPGAFGGHTMMMLSGPGLSFSRRIITEGFMPDAIITSEIPDLMTRLYPEHVTLPVPLAEWGDRQIMVARLKLSPNRDGVEKLLRFLQGEEVSVRLRQAGFSPIIPPARANPDDAVYGEDGEVRIPIMPGAPVGQSRSN